MPEARPLWQFAATPSRDQERAEEERWRRRFTRRHPSPLQPLHHTLAETRYRQTRVRHGKRAPDVAGEVGSIDGVRFVVLHDADARLVGIFRIEPEGVTELEGAALTQARLRLTHRKVRA